MDNNLIKVIEETLNNLSIVRLSNKQKAQAIYDALVEETASQPTVMLKRDENEKRT